MSRFKDTLRPACFKILPLVYDESLSYYELLTKLMTKLNETIKAVEDLSGDMSDVIGEIIEEWLDENLGIPFYNVTYYGIQPDSGDVYVPLHDFLKETVNKTGGIVYFPAGKYTISYTIYVPENTVFCGQGESTEIYFDETDTYLGVALANAGSNVTIENMKITHKSTGVFHSGSQPGAIGFSANSKENVNLAPYEHTGLRNSVRNLTARNLTFEGNYALQTETPSTGFKIENVIYENISAPLSCVSVMPHYGSGGKIENVLIKNVVCDLLRLYETAGDAAVSNFKNVNVSNVDCNTLYVRTNKNILRDPIVKITNLFLNNDRVINNDVHQNLGQHGCLLSANVSFYDSVFNGRSVNESVFDFGNGRIIFNDCMFNTQGTFSIRRTDNTVSPESCQSFYNCIFNTPQIDDHAKSNLIGYGANNDFSNAINLNVVLWGDSFRTRNATTDTGVVNVSNSGRSYYKLNGSAVSFFAYGVIQDGYLFEMSAKMARLPIAQSSLVNLSGIAFNSASPNVVYPFLAYFNENRLVFNSVLTPENCNRFILMCDLPLERIPTPAELQNAFFG